MQINSAKKRSKFPFFFTLFLVFVSGGAGLYYTTDMRTKAEIASSEASKLQHYAKIVEINNEKFTIPSMDWFKNDAMWQLASKDSTLPIDFIPKLTAITTSKASDVGDISVQIAKPFASFVAAAARDGHELTVASAYRSAEAQQKLYDLYMTTRGQEFTVTHVAKPGTSEHQTGMAVDISTLTNGCLKDSDTCTLQPQDIAWVTENAPRFGFIQRYPIGKQSITGITGEEWHYRYVGVALAQFLTKHNLTLDEFVLQVTR